MSAPGRTLTRITHGADRFPGSHFVADALLQFSVRAGCVAVQRLPFAGPPVRRVQPVRNPLGRPFVGEENPVRVAHELKVVCEEAVELIASGRFECGGVEYRERNVLRRARRQRERAEDDESAVLRTVAGSAEAQRGVRQRPDHFGAAVVDRHRVQLFAQRQKQPPLFRQEDRRKQELAHKQPVESVPGGEFEFCRDGGLRPATRCAPYPAEIRQRGVEDEVRFIFPPRGGGVIGEKGHAARNLNALFVPAGRYHFHEENLGFELTTPILYTVPDIFQPSLPEKMGPESAAALEKRVFRGTLGGCSGNQEREFESWISSKRS